MIELSPGSSHAADRSPVELIDSPEPLRVFCEEARTNGPLALDMEFERERTYRPVLQLVQVATPARAVLIDPLQIPDLTAIWELVTDPAIEIIVHAGMQDMEIAVHESGGLLPRAVFDTQIAGALIGMGEQPGYADVVRRLLGVKLKKGERTTDWGRRPLSEAQMRYALDDVIHLHAVREQLHERLAAEGRLEWLTEELRFYERRDTYVKDPGLLWLRVSRHRSLAPRGLAILRELAEWRERTAERRNIPRLRVVADDVLIDLSRRLPRKVDDLRALRRLHPREIERGGHEIVAAVERGLACPEEDLPRLPQVREDDPDLNVTVDLLATFVKYRSREVKVAASYLGNKKAIAAFAQAHRNGEAAASHELGRGWRYELVGRDLEEFLDGRLGLTVDPRHGRLRLLPLDGPED